MAEILYHLCPEETWNAAKNAGIAYYPPSYTQDGFIHLTSDPQLLLPVANHFYKSDPGKWIVLSIESSKLTSEVKYEAAAPVGNRPSDGLLKNSSSKDASEETQTLFPHLYGTIDFDAVTHELAVDREQDGTFTRIQGMSTN